MKYQKQQGFSAVEAGLVAVVIALVGFIGFRVWSANLQAPAEQASHVSQAETIEIKQAADLDKAVTTLDERELDGGSLDELDAQLNY